MKSLIVIKLTVTLVLLTNILIAQYTLMGQTLVGGRIEGEQTWTLAGSPYLINSFLEITQDGKLTIEPGVIVGFSTGAAMVVQGELIAEATSESPITFTYAKSRHEPIDGNWTGIINDGEAIKISLKHCAIQRAISGLNLSLGNPSEVSVENCHIFQNIDGLVLSGTIENVVIRQNLIENNENGVVLNTKTSKGIFQNNLFLKNTQFHVQNFSAASQYLSGNCWGSDHPQDIYPKINDKRIDPSVGEVEIIPLSKSCIERASLTTQLGGGDITVVLDDDLIGTSVDPQKTALINVYPNPASDHFEIKLDGIRIESIELFNVLGEIVYQLEGNIQSEIQVPVMHLKSGLYFLSLKTKNTAYLERVVILR